MPYRDPAKQQAAQRRYIEKHRARVNAASRERLRRRYHADPAKALARWQVWAAENKAHRAAYARRRRLARYGLTPAEFERRLLAQDGLCAACTLRPVQAVDHDHRTGATRGLLCRQCNVAAGLLQDSSALVAKLAAYLESYGS